MIIAVKYTERVVVDTVASSMQASTIYDRDALPPLEWQTSILEQLARLTEYGSEAQQRWRPSIGVWAVWVAISTIMAMAASSAVYRVTKKRLRAAQRNHHDEEDSQDECMSQTTPSPAPWQQSSSRANLSDETLVRQHYWSLSMSMLDLISDQRRQSAMERARWEHVNLTAQFALAAILFPVVEAFILVHFIVGYQVVQRINLMAVTLLVTIGAYVIQGSIAVALVIIRNVRRKPECNPPSSSVHSPAPMVAQATFPGRVYMRDQSSRVMQSQAGHEACLPASCVVRVSFAQTKEIALDGSESILLEIKESPRRAVSLDTAHNNSSYIDTDSEKAVSMEDVKQENESQSEK